MHKGNIMKFTEGAFKDWGYEVAKAEFRDKVITEDELYDEKASALRGGAPVGNANGRVLIKYRIADSMYQQIQLRPDEYSVVATPNLNGDYLSDAVAALVGGIGLAAGANIGDKAAMFEATHGTAPKYTGKNMANPGAVLLSGVAPAGTPGLERGGQNWSTRLSSGSYISPRAMPRRRKDRAASSMSPTTSPGNSPATARKRGQPAAGFGDRIIHHYGGDRRR